VIASISGVGVFTPMSYALAMDKLGAAFLPAALEGVKRAEEVPRQVAVSLFISRGVGRAIFGRRSSGAYKIINVKSVIAQKRVVMALEVKGFAALQEQGGQTKAHTIRAEKVHYAALATKYAGKRRGAKFAARAARSKRAVLAIRLGGGRIIFRSEVRHPGSRIPRHPFGVKTFEKSAARINREIDAALQRALAKLGIDSTRAA